MPNTARSQSFAGKFSIRSLCHITRRRVSVRDEASAASSLVHAASAYGHALFGFKGALRVVCRLAAANADGVRLRYVLGYCEQLRHRLVRIFSIILVQPGVYDEQSKTRPDV